eukprot:547571-Hanusia_phi.AAC.1
MLPYHANPLPSCRRRPRLLCTRDGAGGALRLAWSRADGRAGWSRAVTETGARRGPDSVSDRRRSLGTQHTQ